MNTPDSTTWTRAVREAVPPPPAGEDHDEVLLRSLRMLDPTARQVLVLRGFDSQSWRTVADRAGLPSVSAARRLHRDAVHALARHLLALMRL